MFIVRNNKYAGNNEVVCILGLAIYDNGLMID